MTRFLVSLLLVFTLVALACDTSDGLSVAPAPIRAPVPTPTPIPTPTPPPFETQTLRIGAGEQRSMSYTVESSQLSRGRWCLEYHLDLIQEGSRNNFDLDSFITLPTGEAIRQVTIDGSNSPIQGKVYAESAGRYAVVLDNGTIPVYLEDSGSEDQDVLPVLVCTGISPEVESCE